jgi:hypothetical protein
MRLQFLKCFGFWLLASLLLAVPLRAQDDEEEFTPRSSAPPAQRTGGASRTENDAPAILILAPADTLGLTTREQPVIYWYLSADTKDPIEVGINDPGNLEMPVLEITFKGATKAGLHKLDLSKVKHDGKAVKLQPGVKYEVALTAAGNDTAGSENPSASCRILRVDPKDLPAAAASEKDPAKRAAIFAREGIWFDYIDALNAAIDASPKDESLLQKRAKALGAQRLVWKNDGTITEAPPKPEK